MARRKPADGGPTGFQLTTVRERPLNIVEKSFKRRGRGGDGAARGFHQGASDSKELAHSRRDELKQLLEALDTDREGLDELVFCGGGVKVNRLHRG